MTAQLSSGARVDVRAALASAVTFATAYHLPNSASDYEAAHAAVAELVEADTLLDKCDAALEQHRAAKTYTEAWAATQRELWRSRDHAAKRRAAALARIGGEA